MSIESIADRLNDFSIFGGIEQGQLGNVADLFESGTYAEGDHIIDQGTQGTRLYVITAGKVGISIHSPGSADEGANRELSLATMGRGDCFGEMEILDTQARSATVIALEPTETIELTNMALLKLFERDPNAFRFLIMNLARDLSRRLRVADQRLAELANSGVAEQV